MALSSSACLYTYTRTYNTRLYNVETSVRSRPTVQVQKEENEETAHSWNAINMMSVVAIKNTDVYCVYARPTESVVQSQGRLRV